MKKINNKKKRYEHFPVAVTFLPRKYVIEYFDYNSSSWCVLNSYCNYEKALDYYLVNCEVNNNYKFRLLEVMEYNF